MRKNLFVICILVFGLMPSAYAFDWPFGKGAQDKRTQEEKAEEEKLKADLKKFVPPRPIMPIVPPKTGIELPKLTPDMPQTMPDFAKPPQPLSPFKKGPVIRKKPKKEEEKTLEDLEGAIGEQTESE